GTGSEASMARNRRMASRKPPSPDGNTDPSRTTGWLIPHLASPHPDGTEGNSARAAEKANPSPEGGSRNVSADGPRHRIHASACRPRRLQTRQRRSLATQSTPGAGQSEIFRRGAPPSGTPRRGPGSRELASAPTIGRGHGVDICVARQPILDRFQRTHAYELLFRDGLTSAFGAGDPDRAPAGVLDISFFTFGAETLTGGRPAFVNFTREA